MGETGWISVNDRLPGTTQKVLFINTQGSMMTGRFSHRGKNGACWFVNGGSRGCKMYTATHWIPLPAAPKEV